MNIHDIIIEILKLYNTTDVIAEQLSLSLLCNSKEIEYFDLRQKDIDDVLVIKQAIVNNIDSDMQSHLHFMEANLRYGYIDEIREGSI